jgi:hypothetical protein
MDLPFWFVTTVQVEFALLFGVFLVAAAKGIWNLWRDK